MEQEEFSLYVAYISRELPPSVEGEFEVYQHALSIKRATMRRPERESREWYGFKFERVPVDFDPTNVKSGFVVVIWTKYVEAGRVVYNRGWHFPAITQTVEEANQIKEELISRKGYKAYLEKGQDFDRIEVEPVLITEF